MVALAMLVMSIPLVSALEACASPNDCQGVVGHPYCINHQCRQCNPDRFSFLGTCDCEPSEYCVSDPTDVCVDDTRARTISMRGPFSFDVRGWLIDRLID